MRWVISGFLGLLLIGLVMWSPWMTGENAGQQSVSRFERVWQTVSDGCGFNCQGCGAVAVERVLVGYSVTLEYACGLLPADDPQYHQFQTVYVSPLGTVHGLPRP